MRRKRHAAAAMSSTRNTKCIDNEEAHHSADSDDCIILPALCHGLGNERQLKAAGHPGHLQDMRAHVSSNLSTFSTY